MGIRGVTRMLWVGMGLAIGVASWGWRLGWGENLHREQNDGGNELGVVAWKRVPPDIAQDGHAGREVPSTAVNLARFEGLALQRPVVDVVVAPAPPPPLPPPAPMVQLPPEIVLTGMLVGSSPEKSTAFLKSGTSAVEVLRVGERMKSHPDVEVVVIESQTVTLRYQGQLFLKLLPMSPSLIRKRPE